MLDLLFSFVKGGWQVVIGGFVVLGILANGGLEAIAGVYVSWRYLLSRKFRTEVHALWVEKPHEQLSDVGTMIIGFLLSLLLLWGIGMEVWEWLR